MNKLFGLFLLALACCGSTGIANAAPCFWVGGTGNLNDTAHWSNASGGSVSTCAAAGGWPNSTSDTATFDASSGGGTVTRNVNWTVQSINANAFTGTLGNAGDTASVQLDTWTNTGSGTRTVNMGASTWTCGRATVATCTWSQIGATNLTFNANTSTLVHDGNLSGSSSTMNVGAFTYNVITFNAGAQGDRGVSFPASNITVATINIASPATIKWSNSTNTTVTNLNFTGGSLSSWTSLLTAAANNTYTITLANAATCNYCIIWSANVAITSITANNSINLGTNTNVSFSPPTGGGGGRIIGG